MAVSMGWSQGLFRQSMQKPARQAQQQLAGRQSAYSDPLNAVYAAANARAQREEFSGDSKVIDGECVEIKDDDPAKLIEHKPE